MTSALLHDQIDALLARYRAGSDRPSPQEINDLYTDGCAAVLQLETERLRVKRRMKAAMLDGAFDDDAAREAAALCRRNDELIEELALLTLVVRQLRAAVDWVQEDIGVSAAFPRRRFTRSGFADERRTA